MGVTIIGTGKGLPNRVIDNNEIAKMVDTNNEWIIERTGIKERRVAIEETALDLAISAAIQAMKGINPRKPVEISPESIDLVVVATVTPDAIVPAMSALVKRAMGLVNAKGFDVNMACSGFIYGMWIAEALMKAGARPNGKANEINRALVIGVERLSRILNWEDRNTCIIFGDGAGCVVLEMDSEETGIIGSVIKNYDDVSDSLVVGLNYLKTPFDPMNEKWVNQEKARPIALNSEMYIKMEGTKVFKFAVKAVGEVMTELFEKTGVSPDEVKYYVPHQANLRIIVAAAQRFKQPIDKFKVNIESTGNTSAASVPMALAELMDENKIQAGDKIMLVGFGGGLSAGAILFQV